MFLKFDDENEKVKGEFALRIYKCGKLINEVADHNLVVESGRIRLAELAAGKSNAYITYLGVGSGTDIESPNDTNLQEQILLPIKQVSVNGCDAKFEFEINTAQANGLSIREFALFCSDGTMFSHRVRTVTAEDGMIKVLTIDKEADIRIEGYWILHF